MIAPPADGPARLFAQAAIVVIPCVGVTEITGWWSRRRAAAGPADLREVLFAALGRHDYAAAVPLICRHADEIRRSFPMWRIMPEEIRRSRKASARYAQAMLTIATLFDRSGDDSLMRILSGGPRRMPMN